MKWPNLETNIKQIENDATAIVKAWVNRELVSEKFALNSIGRAFFARHFGIRVVRHLIRVIKGEIAPGQCPVVTVMLLFFKEKRIPLCDIFVICSGLRAQLVEVLIDHGLFSKDSYREIAYLFDKNFEGVIREFFEISGYSVAQKVQLEAPSAPVQKSVHFQEEPKITAAAFLENNDINRDDIEELSDLVEDVETVLFKHEQLTQEDFGKIRALFEKYAHILSEFYEFKDLGYSLTVLAGVLSSYRYDTIAPEDYKKIRTFFESIISDLNSWRKNIFVDADAIDIHYLDESLLSSIAMFEVLLTSDENGDEGDLELF